jgi:hypothetical protein
MVTELQFVAVAAFLIWCLVCSVAGLLTPDADSARLVWREHGPAGWGSWREVHFGLSPANRRVLTHPEPNLDREARAALLDTVREQTRSPESDAVQFAIVRVTSDRHQATAVFVSDHIAVASASPSIDPSLETRAT